MKRYKDAEHFFRLAFVFASGAVAVVLVGAVLAPRSFSAYGRYRGNAITEIAAQPVVYAGHQSCETCHSDFAAVRNKGKHAGVNCEA